MEVKVNVIVVRVKVNVIVVRNLTICGQFRSLPENNSLEVM